MSTDVVVAQDGDLENGDMKQVTADGTDVLLARTGDQYFATHAYCSHYGAPLAEGALSGDRVICPWHHACFRLRDGRHLEPPGQDGLPAFEVRVEDGDVIVRLPEERPDEVPPEMAGRRRPSGSEEEVALVLGGGAAGAYAAEAMRAEGYEGRLVMVTADHFQPYDRVNLSKEYLAGEIGQPADIVLRPMAFYGAHDIEVLQGRTVERVAAQEQEVVFADGATRAYDTLILATGGAPNRLAVDGADLDGVFTLRAIDDSDQIRRAARKADHAVLVGASFIAMECAWSLREISQAAGTDLSVTVVAPEAIPFGKLLGAEVGQMLQGLHEKQGIDFRLEETVARFEGSGGHVETTHLEGGGALPSDLVVIGVGVHPATAFVEGVEKAEDGSIVVDGGLRARFTGSAQADDSLYAAGDIAQFPYWLDANRPTRIEHWRLACQHGRLAGKNAAGADETYRSVPFFWSAQHGSSLRYVGHAEAFDEVLIDGDLEGERFIAYYVEKNRVRAAFGMGRDKEMAAFEELMRREALPDPEEIADADLVALLRTAAEAG